MRKLFILSIMLVCLLTAGGTVYAQSASLNATVRINPLEVKVSAPSNVSAGQWFEVKAEVSNLGTERISRTFATLNTSTGFIVRGREKKSLGSLPSGGTKTVRWRVRAGSSENYVTTVEASGNLAGDEIFTSATAMTSATASLAAFLFRLIFGA